MPKSARRQRLTIALALCFTCACAKPTPPLITPKTARVQAVSESGVQLALSFDVTNPNGFPLLVRAVDGRLLLGAGSGAELGNAHADLSSSIPAHGNSLVASVLTVGWTNLAALAPFMLSPAAVPYRFEGTATVGGERLNVNLPFVLSGELTRDQVISAGLNGLSRPAVP